MRNLLLASVIAVTAGAAFTVPSNAAEHGRGFEGHHHSHMDQRNNFESHRDCRIEVVSHWRNGHRVLQQVRVCE